MKTSRNGNAHRTKPNTVRPNSKAIQVLNKLYRKGDHAAVLDWLQKNEQPNNDPHTQTIKGLSLLALGRPSEALAALTLANESPHTNPELFEGLAKAAFLCKDTNTGLHYIRLAKTEAPDSLNIADTYSRMLYEMGQYEECVAETDRGLMNHPEDSSLSNRKGNALIKLGRFSEGLKTLERAARTHPTKDFILTNLASAYRSMGMHSEAEKLYLQAHKLNKGIVEIYSNFLMSLHYNPAHSEQWIYEKHLEWEKLYGRIVPAKKQAENSKDHRLKLGFISAGFRIHPVGQMIISCIRQLPKESFELFGYSMRDSDDGINHLFKKHFDRWSNVALISDEDLSKAIENDKIDILFDLCGHSEGNRLNTMTMRPAPLQIKWVGGQINTTGTKAIDYFLSDAIETPSGVDDLYTENIIRMPDDYICYTPRGDRPSIKNVPFFEKNHITFGCFNNPSKINLVIVQHWADILHRVPQSHLLLKGPQYDHQEFVDRIRSQFHEHGIEPSRIEFEGHSPHYELLDTYNKIDIALDPWPYSGGLTTCESLIMGVPVVTYPGPTFAGRHSATHLTNAGLPELVANDWDQYKDIAVELAMNPQYLAILRQKLPEQVQKSPLCDYKRFAKNFTLAMRAIWSRYCEDKPPAALTLDKQGKAWFEGETEPFELPELWSDDKAKDFSFSFKGKLVAIDHGGRLLTDDRFKPLLNLQVHEAVVFDPATRLKDYAGQLSGNDLHYVPNHVLGNGSPATLHACLNNQHSSTLVPLGASNDGAQTIDPIHTLVKVSLPSSRLDDIDGVEKLDWLLMDETTDALTLLENASFKLTSALLIQVRLNATPRYQNQATLDALQGFLKDKGFDFYQFSNPSYFSYFNQQTDPSGTQATKLLSFDALFVPSPAMLEQRSENDKRKLAFLLHTAFQIYDLPYSLLATVSTTDAERYRAWLDARFVHQAQAGHSDTTSAGTTLPALQDDGRYVPGAGAASIPLSPAILTSIDDTQHSNIAANSKELYVVDIGANPIDGDPPYKKLLQKKQVKLVGFEPQTDALNTLLRTKGPNETYLPYAVGDGRAATLYVCQASGMTSTLKPNAALLNHFQGYPDWAKVRQEIPLTTVRLDDINEIDHIDWLKIDIQGGELAVFRHGEQKLKDALVIQTEVNFIPLYENQPLFAEIDQWMREHGFMLHTLLEQRIRLFAPYVLKGQIHQGINQLTTADAVYIRDINQLHKLSKTQREKLALILDDAYGSKDLAGRIRSHLN